MVLYSEISLPRSTVEACRSSQALSLLITESYSNRVSSAESYVRTAKIFSSCQSLISNLKSAMNLLFVLCAALVAFVASWPQVQGTLSLFFYLKAIRFFSFSQSCQRTNATNRGRKLMMTFACSSTLASSRGTMPTSCASSTKATFSTSKTRPKAKLSQVC